MTTRVLRRTITAGLVSTAFLVTTTSSLYAGHAGGRPESFQPDLATGRFTASIPIPVPPGRRGLQPTLAISYASGSSAALCGAGWTLEVGGAEKSTRFGVVTATSDKFIFTAGGVTTELTPIGNGHYRAVDEAAFTRFWFDGYYLWEAWDRAGTYYRFNVPVVDAHGRIFGYHLSLVQDLHGNTMTYTYDRDPTGLMLYLTQVDYTGHTSGLLPTNQVKLIWESRPDPIPTFTAGLASDSAGQQPLTTTRRLRTIETYAQGALVRRVTLTYTTSPVSGRSLLAGVQVTGADGTTGLPPTQYTYTTGTGIATVEGFTVGTWLTGVGTSATEPIPTDVNGDARTDLLLFERTTGQWRYSVSTGTSFHPPVAITTYGANSAGFVGDFNGDGFTDLGVKEAAGAVDIALGQAGLTWGPFTRWLSNGPGPSFQVIPADFNGDGKTDFATWEGNAGYVHLWYSTGSPPFSSAIHALTLGPGKTPWLGDVNGDALTDFGTYDGSGNVDVCVSTGSTLAGAARWLAGYGSSTTQKPLVLDLTPDGVADFHTLDAATGTWAFGRSTRTSFTIPAVTLTGFGTGQPPVVGDFNGDGFTDVGYFTTASGSWTIGLRKPQDPPDLLTTLANGLGGTVTLAYAPSSQFPNTDASGQSTLGLVVPVVTRLTVADGRGNSYPTTFSYEGGVFDAGTREFRGFAHATVTDQDGHTVETWFHQDEHKKGKPYKEQVRAKAVGSVPTSDPPTRQIDQPSWTHFVYAGHDGGDNRTNAQSFTVTTAEPQAIDRVEFYCGTPMGPVTGGVRVWVETDAGVRPSGQRAMAGAETVFTPTANAWNTVRFPTPVILQPNTRYWLLVAYAQPITQGSQGYAFGVVMTGNLSPTGQLKGKYASSDWFDPWGTTEADLAFRLWTVPITTAPAPLLTEVTRTWVCTHPWGVTTSHFTALTSVTTALYDGQATPKQTTVDYTYDSYGNPLTQVESGDLAVTGDERTSVTEYVYNTTAWLLGLPVHTQVKDAANAVVRESWAYYDGAATTTATPTKGLLTKEEVWLSTSASKPTSTHAYDLYGNKTSTTDPLGRTTTTTYDTQQLFPIRVTNAVGHTLQTTYDTGTGNILTTTDPNGQVTTTTYDALGRLTSVIGPLDTPSAPGVLYSYDLTAFPSKRVKSVRTTPGGTDLYTSYEFFDGMDRVIQVKTPAEDPTKQVVTGTQTFDNRGLVIEAFKPHLTASSAAYSTPDLTQPKQTFTYDPLGRVTKATNPDATFATTAYSQWVVTLTDETGKQKIRTVDAYGKLVKVEEKVGSQTFTTTYKYDLLGALRATKTWGVGAPGGATSPLAVTQITYDSLGRKTAMTDPDMGTWSYTYDAVGNLLTQTDAKSQPLTFIYDALNRVTRKSVPGTGTVPGTDVVYLYDDPVKPNGVGRLSQVTDGSGTTDFFYDLLGREIKTVKTVGGTSYIVHRTYDTLNRVVTLTYPDTEVVTYTYNPQGVESVVLQSSIGNPQSTIVSNMDYTATGQISQQVANGALATTTYTYDPTTLRLSTLKMTNGANVALQDLTYGFDAVGNVTTLTDVRRTQTQTFTYDDLHRLVSASSPGTYGSRTYAYDAIGNLTAKDGVTQTYAHPTKPHAVTSRSDGLTMTYDANGNMLTKGTQALAYDAENRLIEVTGSPSPGGEGQGEGVTTSFVYDGDGGRVQKVTAAGTTTYLGKLYEQKPDGTFVKYVWVGSNRLASKSSGGALLFYHPNHLGSTDLVTDAQGTQVAHYEYTPYGELFSTEGITVPHKYTGKELDVETGLYYYGARYYDPQLGRFITADPTIQHPGDPQDFNRYSYARGNPIRYNDPSGLGWNPFKKIAKWLGSTGRTVVSAVVAAVAFVASGFNPVAAAMAFSYTNTFLNASAQGASFFRAQLYAGAAAGAAYLGGQIGGAIGGTFGTFWAGVGAGAGGGAAGGATTAATLGGNIGLAAASGAVAGAIGGAVGGLGLDGLAQLAAGAAGSAAGGAAAGAIVGDPAAGALGGFASFAAFAIASGSFQAALDAGQKAGGTEGRAAMGPKAVKVTIEPRSPAATFAPRQTQAGNTVRIPTPPLIGDIVTNPLFDLGVAVFIYGASSGSVPVAAAGLTVAVGVTIYEIYQWANVPATAKTTAQQIYDSLFKDHLNEIDQIGSGR